MRRIWLWGIPIVLMVVVIGIFSRWCYLPGITTVGSPRDEASLQVVSLEDVQSGRLACSLRMRWLWEDWRGTKPDYYHVKQFTEFRPYISDTYGLNGVVLSTEEMSQFYQADTLPYRFVAFFKTQVGTETYLVAVQKWYGTVGKNRLVVYLTPLPSTLPGAYGDVWASALGNDGAVAATPVLYWRDGLVSLDHQ